MKSDCAHLEVLCRVHALLTLPCSCQTQGAPISSHSYGDETHYYVETSALTDDWLFKNQDALVIMAAGNNGSFLDARYTEGEWHLRMGSRGLDLTGCYTFSHP